MRAPVVFAGLAILLGLPAAFAFANHFTGQAADAAFWINTFTAIGVLTAVVLALYAERLRQWVDPVRLALVKPATMNWGDDNSYAGPCRLHHLAVRNLTPHRIVTNCRVWLDHVYEEAAPGEWTCSKPFAVPRALTWAPKEFRPEERTFCTEEVFDFGFSLLATADFLPQIHEKQGGYVTADALSCRADKKRRYYLRITADNYASEFHHIVEVHAVKPASDAAFQQIVTIITA